MPDVVVWEGDGHTFRIKSDDVPVVETPFPSMAVPPTQVLGRDVATGLPKWAAVLQAPPPPVPVSDTFGTADDTDTGTPDPLVPFDAERICGAAQQMAKQLVDIGNITVMAINSAKNSILTLWSNILKQQLTEEFTVLLLAEGGTIFIALTPLALVLVAILAAAILASLSNLPTIEEPNPLVPTGNEIFHIIHCTAYCALQESHGNYLTVADDPTGVGTRQRWRDKLTADWSFFQGSTIPGVNGTDNLPWQLGILVAILDHTTDSLWQGNASDGAHLACPFCTDCGCG